MRENDLHPAPGSRRTRRRIGRGNSGTGGTYAGKGLKGQKGHYRILSVNNATKYKRGDTLTEADVDRLHASGGTTSS